MIIGVFSDAHGNESGFSKCFNYLIERADVIYYLGDSVGYFPMSNSIISTLRANNVICLKGNHDAMLLEELEYDISKEEVFQIEKSRKLISGENRIFLEGLKPEKEVQVEAKKLLFVHGSPFDPLNGYVYPDADISSFADLDFDVIFMGHTHRSFIKKIDKKIIVNVGSCGFSRDIGNKLTVTFYDTNKNEACLKELEIDINEVLQKYGNAIHQSVKDVLTRNNKIYAKG